MSKRFSRTEAGSRSSGLPPDPGSGPETGTLSSADRGPQQPESGFSSN